MASDTYSSKKRYDSFFTPHPKNRGFLDEYDDENDIDILNEDDNASNDEPFDINNKTSEEEIDRKKIS